MKFSIYFWYCILFCAFGSSIAFASFFPNQTLDPNCVPGDINCIVETGYLTGELDSIFTLSPSFGITTGNITNWNTAFGWGNHATMGYLTGINLSSYLTGTKIESINGLTSSSQYFSTGNSGTGFTISSSGSTHTFNLPFSTGGINGLLKGSDWSTFNSKQDTLSAGDNISITGNAINVISTWLLGGNSGGGNALGSSDSVLPFMSNGSVMMQLNNSTLSLSNNQSFVDTAGKNGLFVGNNNSYGNSENVLGIGESINILGTNKNIFVLGDQIANIEENTDSLFVGKNIPNMTRNTSIFSFGDNNTLSKNSDSVFFGSKNNWGSETNKFIIGSNDRRKFQVDMDSGEILFDNASGNAGQYLSSQGPGVAPIWQDFPVFGGLTLLNGLSGNIQTFATGSTGTNFSISSVGGVHTFNLPNASSLNRGLLSALDWGTFNAKQNTISIGTPGNGLTFSGTVLNLGLASATSTGALSPSDWNTFNSKISSALTSINSITGSTQNFAVGTTGNGFSITSTGSTHTFNISDASTITRGLMGTGAQSFTGAKTFSIAPFFSSFSNGSIPFISTGGLLSENNSRLFWDNANSQLLTFSGGTGALPTYSFFGDNDTGMYHPAANILAFSAGGNVVGRMTNLGWSMGDGSISPVSLVHIAGGANPATFRMTNAISLNTINDGFFINYSTGSIVSLSNLENADMIFGTNNSERLRILAGGNLALGQTGATEKLEVNGGIKIGNSATICNATAAGAIRYNSGISKHEGCNGTVWTALY